MSDLTDLRRGAILLGLVFMPLALAACGSGNTASVPSKMSQQTRQFGKEDKRVAELLSIGSAQTLARETSPYNRSLACSIALESVETQLSASGHLAPAITNSINQVSKVYDMQTRQLGTADGKSSAEVAVDRSKRAVEMAGQSEHGQIAIACLRAMT